MHELGLRYKGKRCPFLLENPRLNGGLDFANNNTVVWVEKRTTDWLISNNPRMFEVMGERGKKAKAIIPVEQVKKKVDHGNSLDHSGEEVPVIALKKKRGMPKGGWPKKGKENVTDDDQK